MSTYQPVNIYVVDNTPAANALSGVVVRVFSQDGKTAITQQVTDDSGLAAFLLASEFTYQVRTYKFQTSFPPPQYITVVDPPPDNGFTIVGTPITPPLSQDARLCMAYGFFRDMTGAPAPNVDIQFVTQFDPLIMDGSAVLTERRIARTDSNGYVQIPLIRNGIYSVLVAGMEDMRRDISIPDKPNVNLPDLLFPVVSQITFDPPAPFALTIGTDLLVTPSIFSSDGNTDANSWDVIWSTADETIAVVLPAGGVLTLRGLLPGTTQLIAVRTDQSIIKIPDPGILGIPASITVSA